ncbi:MAG: HD domain-containing protein [Deltaproteobacteria bacterium]|nr:HD domain-containing protein [Deltaproteobacteria bacterium]
MRVSDLIGARAAPSAPPLRLGAAPAATPAPHERRAFTRLYDDITEGIREVGEGVRKGGRIHAGAFIHQVRQLACTPEAVTALLPTAFAPYDPDDFLDRHTSNVVVLALATAEALGIQEENRLCVAFASAAHDLGMYSLPRELLYKRGALDISEAKTLRRHPHVGFSLLRSTRHNVENLARAVYQEHERENGNGYPEGVRSPEIAQEAKIIAVADTFEALMHNRPHRPGLSPFECIRTLTQKGRGELCPRVLRSFLAQITPFPPTSRVQLNDGRNAEVVAVNSDSPLRPVVRVDASNRASGERMLVDLSQTPLLSIASTLEPTRLPS